MLRWIPAALAALVLNACPTALDRGPGDRIVLATVNDDIIYLDEFRVLYKQQELDLSDAIGPVENARQLHKETLLSGLMDELLLSQEARSMHIVVNNDQVERSFAEIQSGWVDGLFSEYMAENGISREGLLVALRRRLVISKYLNREVYARVAVTDLEIETEYNQDPSRYRLSEMVRARQIVVKTEAQAHEILSAIKNKLDFEEAAMKYSLSPDAHRGGDLGFFARGAVPKVFDDICFKLGMGRISDVVESEYGYHIFQVLDRKQAKDRTLEEVRDKIERQLRRLRESDAHQATVARLRKNARIVINKDLLARVP